jgi:hypothetical protein
LASLAVDYFQTVTSADLGACSLMSCVEAQRRSSNKLHDPYLEVPSIAPRSAGDTSRLHGLQRHFSRKWRWAATRHSLALFKVQSTRLARENLTCLFTSAAQHRPGSRSLRLMSRLCCCCCCCRRCRPRDASRSHHKSTRELADTPPASTNEIIIQMNW